MHKRYETIYAHTKLHYDALFTNWELWEAIGVLGLFDLDIRYAQKQCLYVLLFNK